MSKKTTKRCKNTKEFSMALIIGFLLIKRILTSLFFTLFLTAKKTPSRSVVIPDSIPNVSQENKVFQSVLETFFGGKMRAIGSEILRL